MSLEFLSSKPAFERHDAVDLQNRNLESVSPQQIGIGFDVDFFQCVKIVALRPDHFMFHLFTKMTTGFRVKDDSRL